LGHLREVVARAEIAELERGTATAADLVALADARLAEGLRLEAELRGLASRLEREPARAMALLEAHLRATSSNGELALDLEVLRKSKGKLPSLGALGERVAVRRYRLELACEVALARAAELAARAPLTPPAFDALVRLASQHGRHGRRIEALRTLGASARAHGDLGRRGDLVALARRLSDPSEHRWVQPAALDLLATVDGPTALALARGRFERPGASDDFLVRERIVDVARARGDSWSSIVELGTRDRSEHVRLTAVRSLSNPARIAEIARADASAKVRATAIATLAGEHAATSLPCLVAALEADPASVVVETAAGAVTTLARSRALGSLPDVSAALGRASSRAELPERTRVAIAEALASVSVLADPHLRALHDVLSDVLERVPLGGAVKLSGTPLQGVAD
jgi:hypothetical protein